ncbi:MAG: MBL fold metallo-hydrolase [Acetobacteraceae bacterium]|nr:MBL fold metallo-hydrolase [Acetobacteraceae bacterium]
MPFLVEPEPERGTALPLLPGIRRIVAPNPGPMTYHGTNTYLIAGREGLIVLDPGPDSPEHVDAIMRAASSPVSLILLSHTHIDHVGAVAALGAASGAPAAGFAQSGFTSFEPEIKLREGDIIHGVTALHTPGHAADHLCFALRAENGVRALFSGDHVMSWSSSIISPPDGNVQSYLASLERLLGRHDDLYLPGHGPPLPEPRDLVREILNHRRERERTILSALAEGGRTIPALVDRVYSVDHPILRRAAERNVLAHLQKLSAEGRVVEIGEVWRACT